MANDKHTIRAFIALPLPESVKEALGAAAKSAAPALPDGAVRWVKPAALHLTLRFLGDTPAGSLGDVCAALDEAASRHAPFGLQLVEVGCFPNCRRPRVLWVSLRPPGGAAADALAALKADIDSALDRCGWEPETKPFHPHLTLGRIKNPAGLAGFEGQVDVTPVRWEADVVQLIESELLPDGPRYKVRHTAELSSN